MTELRDDSWDGRMPRLQNEGEAPRRLGCGCGDACCYHGLFKTSGPWQKVSVNPEDDVQGAEYLLATANPVRAGLLSTGTLKGSFRSLDVDFI